MRVVPAILRLKMPAFTTTTFANQTCYLSIPLFAALLAGCSGYLPGLPAGYVVGSEPDKGVITGSVGTIPLGKQWREWSRYDYYSTSDPELRGHVTSAVNWSNPFYPQPECPDDGLPAECGNLFAIALPAGEYEFWAVSPAMDSQAADPGLQKGWATRLQGYRFEVKAGQANYLGNILSRLCGGSGHSYYGMARIGSARSAQGNVADRYSRDVPLLLEKFPQLKSTTIYNSTMAGIPWRWDYGQPDDRAITDVWRDECSPARDRPSDSSHADKP